MKGYEPFDLPLVDPGLKWTERQGLSPARSTNSLRSKYSLALGYFLHLGGLSLNYRGWLGLLILHWLR